jgi:hypothetical protein
MLSRNLYKVKKAPLSDRRKKVILSVLLVFSVFFIVYGIYNLKQIVPVSGKKEEVKVETGDRPLKQSKFVYTTADKGLSLRKDRDQNSERLVLIPNKTKLEATEELDGWYQVTYEGKTGWISKQYTTMDAPETDQFSSWQVFSTTTFKIKYPVGWKVKDYGADSNNKVAQLIAFSNLDLPDTIPTGTEFIAPITIKVTNKTIEEAKASYTSISGVTTEPISVGSLSGDKYVYTSTLSNTQMTAVVVSTGSNVMILDEAGGYAEDLLNMIKTFSLGG